MQDLKFSTYEEDELLEKVYNIGKNIRNLRLEQGYTVFQLAQKANMDTAHLSKIETGKTRIGMVSLLRIISALNVSVDELINN